MFCRAISSVNVSCDSFVQNSFPVVQSPLSLSCSLSRLLSLSHTHTHTHTRTHTHRHTHTYANSLGLSVSLSIQNEYRCGFTAGLALFSSVGTRATTTCPCSCLDCRVLSGAPEQLLLNTNLITSSPQNWLARCALLNGRVTLQPWNHLIQKSLVGNFKAQNGQLLMCITQNESK